MEPSKLDVDAAPFFDLTEGPIIPLKKHKKVE